MSGIIGGAGSKSGVIGTTELDYEEGESTASFTSASGTITINSSWDKLYYTRIGRICHFSGTVTIGSVSSPTGWMRVYGLPYTSASGNTGYGTVTVRINDCTSSMGSDDNAPVAYIPENNTWFYVQCFGGRYANSVSDHFGASTNFTCSGTYIIA